MLMWSLHAKAVLELPQKVNMKWLGEITHLPSNIWGWVGEASEEGKNLIQFRD